MNIPELHTVSASNNEDIIIFLPEKNTGKIPGLSGEDQKIIAGLISENSKNTFYRSASGQFYVIVVTGQANDVAGRLEKARIAGFEAFSLLEKRSGKSWFFSAPEDTKEDNAAFLEGLLLSCYQFDKYKTEKHVRPDKINIAENSLYADMPAFLHQQISAVFFARDLVNEPLSFLTAEQLAEEILREGDRCGFQVKIYDKKAIEEMGFHALLAVNRGSVQPPVFTELTWKPENAVNQDPIVISGKGIVYDTGGLSLKATQGSMDRMKSDMGGAAAVAGLFSLIASSGLPVYVKGLIPATDNRPGGDAYVPGDVIKTHKGISVEVLNTDAEGRLILADALSYASQFSPLLTLDVATLTGSAAQTFGVHAAAYMGTADSTYTQVLEKSGFITGEKVSPLPLWDEYESLIESDIADIRNTVGGKGCGAIGAGMFLKHFAPSPWIHLDIAGTAFTPEHFNYRGIQGTGYGVRLLYRFLKDLIPAL
jgi:leucyl aminopeptidase